MTAQTRLLSEIDDYCARVGVAESTFGRMAVNDGKFVARIRAGGGLTLATYDRVRAFLAATPDGAPAAPIGETPAPKSEATGGAVTADDFVDQHTAAAPPAADAAA